MHASRPVEPRPGDPQLSGWITLLCGPMASGKTEELIRLLRRAEIAGRRVLVLDHAIDTRAGKGRIESRSGVAFSSREVPDASAIPAVVAETQPDVIGIEEAEFFDDGIVEVVEGLADEGRQVILTGLDRDFRGWPFGPMPRLLTVADEVVKLTAICVRCKGVATRTQRLIEGRPAPADSPTIVVGGLNDPSGKAETYEARCRSCHQVPGLDSLFGPWVG
ncbi:MAG TPA: thymidine kinase [Candidatus Limnocylindrales bacterium]|nr:thymidine kinase [Candidatus Limnocylindrales bacterium]